MQKTKTRKETNSVVGRLVKLKTNDDLNKIPRSSAGMRSWENINYLSYDCISRELQQLRVKCSDSSESNSGYGGEIGLAHRFGAVHRSV